MVWASTAQACRAPQHAGGPALSPPGRTPGASGAAAVPRDAGVASCGDDGGHRACSPRRRLAEEDPENQRLRAELAEVRADRDLWRARAEAAEGASPAGAAGAGCSESRLRSVMTSHGSTTAELREAIKATQALLDQAGRELAAKQLRERRAAFEQLHQAMDKEDEAALEAALVAARAAEVESVDIEKAEAKFEALRSMTDEESVRRSTGAPWRPGGGRRPRSSSRRTTSLRSGRCWTRCRRRCPACAGRTGGTTPAAPCSSAPRSCAPSACSATWRSRLGLAPTEDQRHFK
ncbi:unnamed protein product, partial [Prorocentrum cordatum]